MSLHKCVSMCNDISNSIIYPFSTRIKSVYFLYVKYTVDTTDSTSWTNFFSLTRSCKLTKFTIKPLSHFQLVSISDVFPIRRFRGSPLQRENFCGRPSDTDCHSQQRKERGPSTASYRVLCPLDAQVQWRLHCSDVMRKGIEDKSQFSMCRRLLYVVSAKGCPGGAGPASAGQREKRKKRADGQCYLWTLVTFTVRKRKRCVHDQIMNVFKITEIPKDANVIRNFTKLKGKAKIITSGCKETVKERHNYFSGDAAGGTVRDITKNTLLLLLSLEMLTEIFPKTYETSGSWTLGRIRRHFKRNADPFEGLLIILPHDCTSKPMGWASSWSSWSRNGHLTKKSEFKAKKHKRQPTSCATSWTFQADKINNLNTIAYRKIIVLTVINDLPRTNKRDIVQKDAWNSEHLAGETASSMEGRCRALTGPSHIGTEILRYRNLTFYASLRLLVMHVPLLTSSLAQILKEEREDGGRERLSLKGVKDL
ncbi:hypothetical protein WN51_07458 [Melipona quadrifasciata]|uniref:Uncharacterized protein n=1 Tax=Melipona quadrifasciata TaxID=166423 RepID=A0A0M9A752_9HYME|nr:hypothetical protein WN51_07458 [Melipona quadrifasciata]